MLDVHVKDWENMFIRIERDHVCISLRHMIWFVRELYIVEDGICCEVCNGLQERLWIRLIYIMSYGADIIWVEMRPFDVSY